MLIKLFGDTNLVSSVSVSEKKAGLFYLINAADKQSYFHRQGGSVYLHGLEEFKTANPVHETFLVCNEDDAGERTTECEVVFIAENDEEAGLMRGGVEYSSVDRGQLCSIILRESLEGLVKELGVLMVDNESSVSIRP